MDIQNVVVKLKANKLKERYQYFSVKRNSQNRKRLIKVKNEKKSTHEIKSITSNGNLRK